MFCQGIPLIIFIKHSILNILEGSEYVLGFKYVRVLNCQYAWVLNFQVYTGFTNFCKYGKVLNMHWDAIMEGLSIFQDFEYVRFLYMQVLHKVLNIRHISHIQTYKKICLNIRHIRHIQTYKKNKKTFLKFFFYIYV